VFAWDVHVGPMTNISAILAPAGALQPIKPFLEKLPADIRDDSKWAGGLEVYTDPARPLSLNVHFTINGGFFVNRDLALASELKSYEDLIDPKWKGKIVIYDPRSANAASETLNTFLSVAGESFVEKLIMEQDMVVVGAGRQATEWVAQGRYPIAIGADPTALAELQQAGVGKSVELVRSTDVRLSQFGMSVLTNAPHPNASIVFMNWFLSHDGQDAWASLSTLDSNSRRFDVPIYRPESRPDYNNLGQYKLWDATEAYQEGMKKAIEIANKKPS